MAGGARGTIFRCSGALYGRTIEQMGGREGLELFRGGNLAGASSSWASCVTPPPVASRFLLPWLSLDGAIRFWGERGMRECASEETGEHVGESFSTLDLSLNLYTDLSFVNYDSSILSSRRPFSPPEGCQWLRADALAFD
jgi:hypothetical protein